MLEGNDNYIVTENGEIYHSRTGRPRVFSSGRDGEPIVTYRDLDHDTRPVVTKQVAHAVAYHFLGEAHKGLEVVYRDGNRENCCVDNLALREYDLPESLLIGAIESGDLFLLEGRRKKAIYWEEDFWDAVTRENGLDLWFEQDYILDYDARGWRHSFESLRCTCEDYWRS